jgi:hypothetical protein
VALRLPPANRLHAYGMIGPNFGDERQVVYALEPCFSLRQVFKQRGAKVHACVQRNVVCA